MNVDGWQNVVLVLLCIGLLVIGGMHAAVLWESRRTLRARRKADEDE